jgi:hypothetical protein
MNYRTNKVNGDELSILGFIPIDYAANPFFNLPQ